MNGDGSYRIRWPGRADAWRAAAHGQLASSPVRWLLGLSLLLTTVLLLAFVATVLESVDRGDRLRMAQRAGHWPSLKASFDGQTVSAGRVDVAANQEPRT